MQPLQLLLVDDNPRARHGMIALMSTHPEIRIVGEASNGREAIAVMEAVHSDVILMDVQMPVMDGVEATRLIKRRWPRVRVVALTLHPNYDEKARLAGADAFLVKGCSSEELLSAILGMHNDADSTQEHG
ncbi:MAG: response regulator [Chloroflexota bacterium]